ncbi:MAG: sigma-70 family RNA polymerase sigma factor [Slackia faecicanis]|nr:sigma-70 family RNA polymerase sigma factor [Slackia faecicanis]
MRTNNRYHAHVDPDTEARRLVNAYSGLILRLSFTYLKSTHDAQDICQSVLVKLIGRAEPFQDEEHEKAWVVRATANACKDLLRDSYRRTSAPLEAAAEHPAPEAPVGSDVLDAVMTLDEKYREAIYLHYYEGYSIAEIAALTDRSASAVAAHLSRGRTKLRFLLGDAASELGPEPNDGADNDDPVAKKHAARAPSVFRKVTNAAHGATQSL